MINGISILICTYNGAERLPETLNHLAKQIISHSVQWEIILVNNNSSDNTTAIAQQIWKEIKCITPFRVISEPRPGKSFALELGISNAKYDVLLICDDDNWLDNEYVQYAYDFMNNNLSIGVLGSRSVAFTEIPRPLWFEKYENVFAVGKQLPKTGTANKKHYVFGAGMVIRKKIYNIISDLDHELFLTCRKGNELSSGGDSEICLLAMQLGYDLYYDERLQFTHYITANRLRWKYCVDMITKGFAHPQIYYAMYDYCFTTVNNNETPSFKDLIKWNLRKQKRILINEFKGLKNFFSAIAVMLYSREGSDKEVKVKTAINKIQYIRKNKKQLSEDFDKILELAKRIKQYRLTNEIPQEQKFIQ